MKKYFVFCASILLLFIFSINATAAHVYFEYRTGHSPSRAVDYERILQVTSVGLRDIHILRVPLNDPYIQIAPVASQLGVGHRKTTSALLAAAGAVAGVNADFFDMTAPYALQIGTSIRHGELLASNATTNRYNNGMATFFLDVENNAFFDFINVRTYLYVHGFRHTHIPFVNNVGNRLDAPVAFTSTVMTCTTALDARFPGTVKIVSDGTYISHISQVGETVIIPPGGFVVVLPPAMAHERYWLMPGAPVRLEVVNNLNLDFFTVQSAVSGAGLLVANGELVSIGHHPTGRHPRTGVGVTADGNTLILMVIDGRNASVGASHYEFAELMRQAGAHNAMHFDGGGSATMVVYEHNRHGVVNTPSEGAPRQVINALGIFDYATPGEIAGIVAFTPQNRIAVGAPVPVYVMGVDAQGMRFPLSDDAHFSFMTQVRDAGVWQENVYTPLRPGVHQLQIWYGFFWATHTIYVLDVAELHAAPIAITDRGTANLHFAGTAFDGTHLPEVQVTDLAVFPHHLGVIENGVFRATDVGTGYIRARMGTAVVHIPVSVGRASAPLPMIWSLPGFAGYPENLVHGTTELVGVSGHMVSRLTYHFTPSAQTQAAHLIFNPPLLVPISGEAAPTHLRMQVHGDGSGHWLRGRITDAYGIAHTIDFTRNADFVGWGIVTAALPADLAVPFTLDRVWMAALNVGDYAAHSVTFYNIQALYAPETWAEVPANSRFRDPLMTHGAFEGVPSSFALYRATPTERWEYNFNLEGNTAVVRLSSTATGPDDRRQWEWLVRDIARYNPCHVIIRMNTDPQRFTAPMFTMFHALMQEMASTGRTVLVVSPAVSAPTLAIRDGVRYINTAYIRVFTHGYDLWWYGGM